MQKPRLHDRKQSCPIALWQSTVSQQYIHYPRPQDSGNHEDCTYVELHTKKGKTHDYALKEEEGKTFLNINCAVMGLGNSSCGPGVLKKYAIDPNKKHQLRIRILD